MSLQLVKCSSIAPSAKPSQSLQTSGAAWPSPMLRMASWPLVRMVGVTAARNDRVAARHCGSVGKRAAVVPVKFARQLTSSMKMPSQSA